MKTNYFIKGIALFTIVLGFYSCEMETMKRTADDSDKIIYTAELRSINSEITGMHAKGMAKFVIENDTMYVSINMVDTPAKMMHWQHFHGFEDGSIATCVTDELDTNGDGVIDVIETEAASGTTMVPFNELPVSMDIGDNSYPISGHDGTYVYEAKIPMDAMEAAFTEVFGRSGLSLDSRVLYVHGVPSYTELPETVASIGDIPAHVTIPIACGKIERTN